MMRNPLENSADLAPIILPATADEIPSFARISISSSHHEVLFASPFFFGATPAAHYEFIIQFCQSRITSSSWLFVKAVDPLTQDVIGWASSVIEEADWDNKPDDYDVGTVMGFVGKERMRVQREWLAGRRFLLLASIYVEPEWQGKGVGTQLITRCAHERADSEGLLSYLMGTAVATPFYRARGWRPAEILEVDINDWVKGVGLGYGIYKIGFMIRLPSEKTTEKIEEKETEKVIR
jgi:GNAT superfamily N-acetyltransferase